MTSQAVIAESIVESTGRGGLRVEFADSLVHIHEAQRLRYDVFARELGARLHTPVPGLDFDHYDAHCRHVLVRESLGGQVVGCTRLLTRPRAARTGGFYSQSEFDLGSILSLPGRFMEIGRTCVHPEYRNGATIAALWSGLALAVVEEKADYLFGCASIPLGEDGAMARAVYTALAERYLTAPELRVRPHIPLPARDTLAPAPEVPALLKAYLRIGAQICGEPYLDRDFGVADLFILLPTARLARRYARHFVDRVS